MIPVAGQTWPFIQICPLNRPVVIKIEKGDIDYSTLETGTYDGPHLWRIYISLWLK